MPSTSEASQPKPFRSPAEIVLLNLLRAHDALTSDISRLLQQHVLSMSQYNALRILRGAGAKGLPCSKIGARMLTRDPDITRLLDRLEKRKLISRERDTKDRRVVKASITEAGVALLADLDPLVDEQIRSRLGHMSAEQLRSLAELLEIARINN